MFQSEQLQEKWAPLLNYEGLEEIKDSHKRTVTATLLENQEKFLREQNSFAESGSFLTEQPTNSGGNPQGLLRCCYCIRSCCWFRPRTDLLDPSFDA